MSGKRELTLQVFRAGFVCGRSSANSVPSTSEEVYDILQEVGIGIRKGDTVAEVRRKVDSFLNSKNYDRAMKIV